MPGDFYLGKYEVTQEEWQKVTGVNPSHFSRSGGGKDEVKGIPDEELKRFPVELVSWDDCAAVPEGVEQAGQGRGLGVSLTEGGGVGVRLSWRTDGGQAR